MSLDDKSPSMDIPTAEDEVYIPDRVQDTPLHNLGGLRAGADQLSHGKVRIAGTDERIYFGDATDIMDGVGIVMGKVTYDGDDNKYYDFRFGDPENNYVRWDEKAGDLIIQGQIIAGAGSDVDWSYINNVAIENADIVDATIEAAKISSLDADDISSGTVSAGYVAIGSSTTYETDYDPSTKLDSSDVGDLADYNLVENAMEDETIIVNGYIDTSYLTADNITTGTLDANDVTVTNLDADNITAGDISADYIEADAGTLVLNSDGGIKFQMPGSSESTGNAGLIIEDEYGNDRLKMNDNAFITHEGQAFAAAVNTTSTFGSDWFQMYGQNDKGVLIMPGTNEFQLQQSDNDVILDVNGNVDSMAVNDGYSIGSPNVGNMINYSEIDPSGSWGEYQVRLDIVPGSDASGQIGNSTYAWDIGWFWTLYTDDGNVSAWQTHDDIQMIKDIGTKQVKKRKGKKGGPVKRHSKVWDLSGLPEEIQKDGKVSHGSLNGLLIGTFKQLIDKVETLEQEVEALK